MIPAVLRILSDGSAAPSRDEVSSQWVQTDVARSVGRFVNRGPFCGHFRPNSRPSSCSWRLYEALARGLSQESSIRRLATGFVAGSSETP